MLNGRSHYLAGSVGGKGRGGPGRFGLGPAWVAFFHTFLLFVLFRRHVCVCERTTQSAKATAAFHFNKTFRSGFFEYFLLLPLRCLAPTAAKGPSCQLFRFLNFVFGRFLFTPLNFFLSLCLRFYLFHQRKGEETPAKRSSSGEKVKISIIK